MILDLEGLYIPDTSFFLPVDIRIQLGRCHRLAIIHGNQEVRGHDGQGRILTGAFGDMFPHAIKITDHIIDNGPLIKRVVFDRLGGQTGDQFLILEMLQRETVSHVRASVIAIEISDNTRLDLQLGVLHVVHLLVADILVLEINTSLIRRGNDVSVQDKRHDSDNRSRDRIRKH